MIATYRTAESPSFSSAVAFLLLSVCGCSSVPQSGFLGDYSRFHRHGEDSRFARNLRERRKGKPPLDLELWVDDRQVTKLSDYDRMIVEPVQVTLTIHSTANWSGEDEVKDLARHAEDAFKSAVKGRLAVVDEAGNNTLRVRVAIVGVETRSVPIESNIDQSWHHVRVGGATLEAEAVDSVSGERVLGGIVKGRGTIISQPGRDRLEDARDVVDSIAAVFRQRLDENPPRR